MKERRPGFRLKYFSVLKDLFGLANFDAIGAIEKAVFNKINNKVQ